MITNRDRGISLILNFEDPGLTGVITTDLGGRTRYGIAEKFNPEAWKNGPPTLDQAKLIYLNSYWIPGGCDALQFPLDIAVADCCVNPGPGAAKTILSTDDTFPLFMRGRMRYYCDDVIRNPHLLPDLTGWILRVLNLWKRLEEIQ